MTISLDIEEYIYISKSFLFKFRELHTLLSRSKLGLAKIKKKLLLTKYLKTYNCKIYINIIFVQFGTAANITKLIKYYT